MTAVNGNDKAHSPPSPLVLGDNQVDDSTISTSDVTWPEIDGHLGDLAQIHDPGYYDFKPSMEQEHAPLPSLVSCIQLLEETKTEKEDGDVTAEYINEIVEAPIGEPSGKD